MYLSGEVQMGSLVWVNDSLTLRRLLGGSSDLLDEEDKIKLIDVQNRKKKVLPSVIPATIIVAVCVCVAICLCGHCNLQFVR